jgi:hypothetical protein
MSQRQICVAGETTMLLNRNFARQLCLRTPTPFVVGLFFTLSLAAHAQTTTNPPAAPQVTIGAQLKALRFDWNPVPGATYYRLWKKTGTAAYVAVDGTLPASSTSTRHYISVHREVWATTLYQLRACNAAGCSASAPLNPQPLMLDTIGYFKASNTDPNDYFGRGVVVSDDGLTLAVTAENEASSATGVNGDQSDNSMPYSGAVYIFRRSGSSWRQDGYLKAPWNVLPVRFGVGWPSLSLSAVALNRDGSMAVIAAPGQASSNVGSSGEVYVFQRSSTGWKLTATIRPPEPQSGDFFGYSVDLSLDGNTLKVSSHRPSDPDSNHEGRTHIYRRGTAGWQHEVTLAPYYAGDFCPVVRMSGDGGTLVASCYSLVPSSRAVTFKRIGGAWVHVSDLALPRYRDERTTALNFDGTALALGLTPGVVGVYRWNGSEWVNEGTISPPAAIGPSGWFGASLAFDRPGNQLAIGDFASRAAGAGVSATPTLGSEEHGAVFLYRRSTAPTTPWRLRSVVKAPNPGTDWFGISLSLSGSGKTLAVGATQEDSAARGVDGDQTDESAPDAGAAYLY